MPEEKEKPKKLGTWESIKTVSKSWRMGSVALLMFSSSLPLGLVWIAIPAWMTYIGADIKVVGLFTLAQAPWSFKFLWAPLVDRYPMPFLGRKRGWILVTQVVMLLCGLGLAGAAQHPDTLWVIGALALATAIASATHDIAYDAYAVEVLKPEEYGMASGARVAFGRLAMLLSGGTAITMAVDHWSWPTVNLLLALCYLPLMIVTWKAPEPEVLPQAPRSLREAVWDPFVGFLAQHRAVEILAFVILFKLSDNLTQALLRPFFVQMGYNAFDVGLGSMLIGTVAMVIGGTTAGLLTQPMGLGRALWIFGFLQIFSNLGYAVVAMSPTRFALYAAQFVEMGTSGLGTGAYLVLLLRLTQKRFSATQYALLSSLMSITRVFTGPITGFLVDVFGWRDFFVLTLLSGIPGMVLLARFVPWSVRDPQFYVASPKRPLPLTRGQMVARAAVAGIVCAVLSVVVLGLLGGVRSYSAGKVRAQVVDVTPAAVTVQVRISEGSLAGNVKAIREVSGPVAIDEFAGQPVPAVGERVTVVQEKAKDGSFSFSRRKVGERRFDPGPRFAVLLKPVTLDDWLNVVGIALFSLIFAMAVAATLAARRSTVSSLDTGTSA
jgi:MFS transporter, PAT family, beta-lactamase induction signal transducer AmpG